MKRKLWGFLFGLLLCLVSVSPAFAADDNTVTVTVYEMEPGYYMCAVWNGDTLLTLFDAEVGNDGVLHETVDIGDTPISGDTVQVAISTANIDSDDAEPIVIKDVTVGGSITVGTPNTPSTPGTPGATDTPSKPSTPDAPSTPNTPSTPSIPDTSNTPDYPYYPSYPSGSGGSSSSGGKNNPSSSASSSPSTPSNSSTSPAIPSANEPEKATPSTPANTNISLPFVDVSPSNWFYTAVQYVYANGLMTGDGSKNIFNPRGSTTRAMVWTVLGRMSRADVEGNGTPPWYAKARDWAVTTGISDGTNPTASISRQELMTMLWRYMDSPAATADLSQFSDHADVSTWANDAMQWAVSTGLLVGDKGCLNPRNDAKRSEVATIFMRFCENIAG